MDYKITIFNDDNHTIEELYVASESRKRVEWYARDCAKGNRFYISEDTSIKNEDSKLATYSPRIIAVSKLAKVEIAAEDYNVGGKEIDGVHYFTFDEALKVQEELKDTGWRLPTRSEWVLIAEEFGEKDGELDYETMYNNLNMTPVGYYNHNYSYVRNRTTGGSWWSGVAASATRAYYLDLYSDSIDAQNYNDRGHGFALRLVRDVDWGNGAKV